MFHVKTPEIAKLLIDKGADVNAKDKDGKSLLDFVILNYDNLELIKLLIDKGANVNAKDKYGFTPLFSATPEIAKLLIANGADVNVKDKSGETPLACAVISADLYNIKGDHGCTALDLASMLKSQIEYIKFLIDNGADVNAKNTHGETPLYFAKNFAVARLLIEKGADVNIKDNSGNTPLHCVKTPQIARMLIEKGADINAEDKFGTTPLDCAKNDGNTEIIKVLESYKK